MKNNEADVPKKKYMVYAECFNLNKIKGLFPRNIVRNFTGMSYKLSKDITTSYLCGVQTQNFEEIAIIKNKLIENDILVFGLSTARLEDYGWIFGELETLE